ncbi:peptidase domain-containing ABC transporter, partial [Staphylococcus pseudintermedius]|nr:peptidase domain-containing ABC transporter [Staphylococcus pseudintermedius]
EIFTLIILDINKEKHFSKSNEVTTVRKVLMPLLKNNVKFLILIIVISLLINLVGIAGALYFQYLIDDIIPIEDFHALHKVSASILLLYFINLFVSFFRYYLSLKISLNIDYSLMKKYYNHVIKLPSSFFDNRKTGEILSRFNDIHNIRESLSSVTVTLFVDLILVLGGSIILYQESGILLLLCSCILPIYIILSLVLKRPFEINNRKLMEESAVLSSYLIESFENNLIIKSYNYENDMYSRGKKRFNSLVNKALKLGLYNNYQLSISNFVNIFISLIVLWVGSYLVIDK